VVVIEGIEYLTEDEAKRAFDAEMVRYREMLDGLPERIAGVVPEVDRERVRAFMQAECERLTRLTVWLGGEVVNAQAEADEHLKN